MSSVAYVNYAGQPVRLDSSLHAKTKAKREEKSFHNGWRVIGIPPGLMEETREQHNKDRATAMSRAEREKGIKIPKPWDEDFWRNNFKKKPIRSKPYEIPEAAQACKSLAEKAGWTFIEIVEIKKEVRA